MVKKAPPTTSNGGQNGGHHLTSIGITSKFTIYVQMLCFYGSGEFE